MRHRSEILDFLRRHVRSTALGAVSLVLLISDVFDVFSLPDQFIAHWPSIVAFGESPYFPWFSTACYIAVSVWLIHLAAARDRNARASAAEVQTERLRAQTQMVEQLEGKVEKVSHILTKTVRHLAAIRRLEQITNLRTQVEAKRKEVLGNLEKVGMHDRELNEYKRKATDLLSLLGFRHTEIEDLLTVNAVDIARFDGGHYFFMDLIEKGAPAEIHDLYRDDHILFGKVEKSVNEKTKALADDVEEGRRLLDQMENNF